MQFATKDGINFAIDSSKQVGLPPKNVQRAQDELKMHVDAFRFQQTGKGEGISAKTAVAGNAMASAIARKRNDRMVVTTFMVRANPARKRSAGGKAGKRTTRLPRGPLL